MQRALFRRALFVKWLVHTLLALLHPWPECDRLQAATDFASGIAPMSNTVFTLLAPGDRVVLVKETYGGTNQLFLEFLPRINATCVLCDTTDHAAIEVEIAKGCRVLYLETPTNLTLKVIDSVRLAAVARRYSAVVVIGNTFAAPINQRPREIGSRNA